ncbi:protein tyrosine phosphatase [Pseudohyphozyma bogoriensis]|nr:protein tyrosine phosphatase [Pseudohyphozyma bogoriensis]
MPPKSAASTPTKKLSPAQRTHLAKSDKALTPVSVYLVAYNVASAAAWAYVLARLVAHLASDTELWSIKGALGIQGWWDKLLARASTGSADFGTLTKWVQTAAVLEVVHSALGLVRSGFGTTLAQVFSRILLVWYVAEQYPIVTKTPIYCTMVFAWAFTEVVRYTFYAAGLLNIKLPILDTIRYNAFYLLYPMGAGSEAYLIWKSAPYAKALYGDLGYYGTYAIFAIWPPALAFLMSHMHAQRRKFMRGGKSGKKSITSGELSDAGFVGTADTPARRTRSKVKAQ